MSMARQAVTRLTLDMSLDAVQKSVSISKGDTNRRMEITLTDAGRPFTLPSTWTATLSGGQVEDGCAVERGRILYDLSSGVLTAETGIFELAFRIFDEEGDEVATPMITCNVYDVERNTAAVASTDEFSVLKDFIKNINEVDTRLDTLERLIRYSRIEIDPEESDFLWSDNAKLTIRLPDTIAGYDYAAILIADDPWTLKWAQRLELTIDSVAVSGVAVTATISREPATGEDNLEDETLRFTCVAFLTQSSSNASTTASFVGLANFPKSVEGQVVINTVTLSKTAWEDTFYGDQVMVFGPNWGEYEEESYNRAAAITLYPLDDATRDESQRLGLTATAAKYSSGMTYVFLKKGEEIPTTNMRFLAVLTGADATNENAEAVVPVYVAGVSSFPQETWEREVKQVVDALYPRISVGVHTIAPVQWSDSDPLRADLLAADFDDHSIVLLIPMDADTRRESQRIEVTVHSYSGGDDYGHIWLLASQSYPPPTLTYESLIIKMPDPLPEGFVPTAAIVGVSELSDDFMDREVKRVLDANKYANEERVTELINESLGVIENGSY